MTKENESIRDVLVKLNEGKIEGWNEGVGVDIALADIKRIVKERIWQIEIRAVLSAPGYESEGVVLKKDIIEMVENLE